MGKKITSSSPINTTIAFNQVPNYFNYSNDTLDLKPPAAGTSDYLVPSQYHGSSLPPASDMIKNDKKDDISLDIDHEPSDPSKPEGRKARLERKINEAADKGQLARQARLEKRLAGYQIGQTKRSNQIGAGKTFFGRLISNVKDIVDKDAHTGKYDDKDKEKKHTGKSRHDLKVEEASKINKRLEIWRKDRDKPPVKNDNPVTIQNKTKVDKITSSNIGDTAYTRAKTEGECADAGGRWSQGECWSG